MRTMSISRGKRSMGLIILTSLQSTLGDVSARSPSFIAAVSTNICRGCREMCSGSGRRVRAIFACDLAYLGLGQLTLARSAVPKPMLCCLAVCPGFLCPHPYSLLCKSVSVVCYEQASHQLLSKGSAVPNGTSIMCTSETLHYEMYRYALVLALSQVSCHTYLSA